MKTAYNYEYNMADNENREAYIKAVCERAAKLCANPMKDDITYPDEATIRACTYGNIFSSGKNMKIQEKQKTEFKKICEEAAKRCIEQYRYYDSEQDKFITHQEVIAKQSLKSEPEPELCFPELMFFDNKIKDVELVQSWEDFVIGDKYYIWARRIKSKQRRMYILKHVIGMLNNDCLNICIMKQCSGPASMKFTLTEADCENIGIEFEAGLEVYPVNVGWVKCQPSKTNKERPKTQSVNSYN